MQHTGTVIRFNKIKGYGFIKAETDNQEIFVHFSEVQAAGYKELKAGQHISYTLKQGEKGAFATHVQVIKE
ncbi:MAG: cold shock domain-containing protein [Legionella sp.]|nr:cold shock domain-containing protein [Legionella sp.]